jgi:hypothetical protein
MKMPEKMLVWIGSRLRVETDDSDVLDFLVKRYGDTPPNGVGSPSAVKSISDLRSVPTLDAEFLRALCAGRVPGSHVAKFLNTRGQGIRKQLEAWARKQKIWTNDKEGTFKYETTKSGQRFYSLTPESKKKAEAKLTET